MLRRKSRNRTDIVQLIGFSQVEERIRVGNCCRSGSEFIQGIFHEEFILHGGGRIFFRIAHLRSYSRSDHQGLRATVIMTL